MELLPPSFFTSRDTPTIARALLGKTILHHTEAGPVSGIIVETEAYLSTGDPASHTARGLTERNRSMFGPPGHSYVYLSYGIHHCMNVVCQRAGIGEGVLIRALEPVQGLEIMRENRGQRNNDRLLTNGPGKLCQALAIDRRYDGHDLKKAPLYLLGGETPQEIGNGPRIGISVGKELKLRFFVARHPFVSRP